VAVTVEAGAWRAGIASIEAMATDVVRAAVAGAKAAGAVVGAAAEVSVLFSDDAAVQRLNGAYRGRAEPTNVLSFPGEESEAAEGEAPRLLGDIVLAYETCAHEASAGGIPLADHARHLLVHGVLHLLGYDHQQDAAAERMERLETAILGDLGVPDPYARANAP
jgi:probable rRNA maturation factor